MVFDRVASSIMKKSTGSYVVYATPIDGSEKAYKVKGQPKGMSQVEAYDFGVEYAKSIRVAIDVIYKGK